MSVTVSHLNADSTFLLTFHHNPNPDVSDLSPVNGAYTVLIDPWFTGSSIVNAKWFAVTSRVLPSAVNHVSELEEPDVILVSQNKPDHCHKETLLQLDPTGKTIIAAEPGAAKTIKSWNYFDPNRVIGLSKYDPKARFGNCLRLRIPPLGPDGLSGELNIAFIPAKNYMTGLHNAFGITYQAPTSVKAVTPMTTIDLPKFKSNVMAKRPSKRSTTDSSPTRLSGSLASSYAASTRLSPTSETMQFTTDFVRGHRPRLSRSSNTQSSELLSTTDRPSLRYSEEESSYRNTVISNISQVSSTEITESMSPIDSFIMTDSQYPPSRQTLPTPPQSPNIGYSSGRSSHFIHSDPSQSHSKSFKANRTSFILPNSPNLRYSRVPTIHPALPKAISVLYTPHGIPLSDLGPYISNHLVTLPGALPLTLLLHSFDHTQNPWYLGGNITAGAEGGVEIAKALMARTWISAHDEAKDDRGVAVKLLKVRRAQAEEIQRKLLEDQQQQQGTKSQWTCDVRSLEVGPNLTLSSEIREVHAVHNGKSGLGVLGNGLGLGEEVRMGIDMRDLRANG